jgi:DNA-binding FrmR family transcriptional regulator
VLTQVSATTPALPSVALELLEDHLTHCVTEADGRGGEEAHRKPREASAAIARLVTS